MSVRCYVDRLQKFLIQLCKNYGIDSTTNEHTGVWVKDNKIAAIGTINLSFLIFVPAPTAF